MNGKYEFHDREEHAHAMAEETCTKLGAAAVIVIVVPREKTGSLDVIVEGKECDVPDLIRVLVASAALMSSHAAAFQSRIELRRRDAARS